MSPYTVPVRAVVALIVLCATLSPGCRKIPPPDRSAGSGQRSPAPLAGDAASVPFLRVPPVPPEVELPDASGEPATATETSPDPHSLAAALAKAQSLLQDFPPEGATLEQGQLLAEIAHLQWWHGQYVQSLQTAQQGIAVLGGAKSQTRGVSLLCLLEADALASLGRIPEAKQAYLRLLNPYEDGFPRRDIRLCAQLGLARLLLDEQNPVAGKAMFQRAFVTRQSLDTDEPRASSPEDAPSDQLEQEPPPGEPDAPQPALDPSPKGTLLPMDFFLTQSRFLVLLGRLAATQQDYEAAANLLQQASSALESTYGTMHPYLLEPLLTVGMVSLLQGDVSEAAEVFGRCLNILEQNFGPTHPWLSEVYRSLALINSSIGDNEAAESLYNRAITLIEGSLGPNHPWLSTPLNNLGELYRSEELLGTAEDLLNRALHIDEAAFGTDSPRLTATLANLAMLRENQGMEKEAHDLYQRALAISTAVFGANHPNVSADLNNLATYFLKRDRLPEARETFSRSLEILRKAAGIQHVSTATTAVGLAEVLQKMGEFDEAESLYLGSIPTLKASLGEGHPYVAMAYGGLVEIYNQTGQTEKAEQAMTEVVMIMRPELLQDELPDTAVPSPAPDR